MMFDCFILKKITGKKEARILIFPNPALLDVNYFLIILMLMLQPTLELAL